MNQGLTLAPPPVIGLLGAIGCGKSAVAQRLSEHGALVLNADAMVHELLVAPEVISELRSLFGPSILDAAGQPDRKAIAALVFAPKADAKRAALEQLLHPKVFQRLKAAIGAARSATTPPTLLVLDVPLLAEHPTVAALCDRLVFINSPRELCEQRCHERRGWSSAEYAAREAAQLPPEQKRVFARHVLQNSGTVTALHKEVDELLDGLLAAHRLAHSIGEHGPRAHGGLGPAATAHNAAAPESRTSDPAGNSRGS